jgi:hypothetical protein
MSTLQVANLHLESTGNTRVQFVDNKLALVVAGANVVVGNTTQTIVYAAPGVGTELIFSNSSTTQIKTGNTTFLTVNSTTAQINANTNPFLIANATSVTVNNATIKNPRELVNVSATAATGTINYNIYDQSILYYTSNTTANWTLNLRANSTVALNSHMNTGETITVTFMATQNATPFFSNTLQIDGTSVTPRWIGGAIPTAGTASGIDIYSYTVFKTGSATYTVLASQNYYA